MADSSLPSPVQGPTATTGPAVANQEEEFRIDIPDSYDITTTQSSGSDATPQGMPNPEATISTQVTRVEVVVPNDSNAAQAASASKIIVNDASSQNLPRAQSTVNCYAAPESADEISQEIATVNEEISRTVGGQEKDRGFPNDWNDLWYEVRMKQLDGKSHVSRVRRRCPEFPGGSYLRYVQGVARSFPILEPVCGECTYDYKLDVIVLDILKDGTCLNPATFGYSHSIKAFRQSLASKRGSPAPVNGRSFNDFEEYLKKEKSEGVAVRLFLVEDLSPVMIEALGYTLGLDPSFFAEHLVEANYGRDSVGVKEKIPGVHEVFDSQPKRFFSSTWKQNCSETWEYGQHGRQVNISRPDHEIGESGRPLAVEERMTVTLVNDEPCLTGVFLFDPLRTLDNAVISKNNRPTPSIPSFQKFQDGREYDPESSHLSGTRNQFATCILYITKNEPRGDFSTLESVENTLFPIIFRFILNHWNGVFSAIHKALDSIDTEMANNNILQTKLLLWRKLLGGWKPQLVQNSILIYSMSETVRIKGLTGGGFTEEFAEALRGAKGLTDRAGRTFDAIMSSMAIVESQRAIEQAESISRLTELAFVFIPLGLATSIFGMQINTWTEHFRPWMWITLSVVFVVGSYTFRLSARSRLVKTAIENSYQSAVKMTTLPKGARVPTTSYLLWAFTKLYKLLLNAILWFLRLLVFIYLTLPSKLTSRKFVYLIILTIYPICIVLLGLVWAEVTPHLAKTTTTIVLAMVMVFWPPFLCLFDCLWKHLWQCLECLGCCAL